MIIPEIPTARDTATTREAALIHGAETLREREPAMEPGYITRRLKQKEKRLCK